MIVATTQQFTATGRYSDGTEVDRTLEFQWRSTGAAVTIDASGLATSQSVGMVSIVATDPVTSISSDFTNESAVVTVSDAVLLSIRVTPTTTSAPAGAQIQFTATGTYDNTATADLTTLIDWSSSNPTAVEISNTRRERADEAPHARTERRRSPWWIRSAA